MWAVLVTGWLIIGLFPGPRGWDVLAIGGIVPAALLYWIVYTLIGLAGIWVLLYAYDPYPPPEHDEILINAAKGSAKLPRGEQSS